MINMLHVNKGKTLNKIWLQGLEKIINKGRFVQGERGGTYEFLNLISVFPENADYTLPKDYVLGEAAVDQYKDSFLNKNKGEFIYTYGNRIREYFGCDQYEKVIEKLKKFQNTRRAIAITWDPIQDNESAEVPCLITIIIQQWEDTLYFTGVWRSHDYYRAFPANIIGFKNFADHITDEVQGKIGQLLVHSVNAHVYEYDVEEVKKIILKRRDYASIFNF